MSESVRTFALITQINYMTEVDVNIAGRRIVFISVSKSLENMKQSHLQHIFILVNSTLLTFWGLNCLLVYQVGMSRAVSHQEVNCNIHVNVIYFIQNSEHFRTFTRVKLHFAETYFYEKNKAGLILRIAFSALLVV